MSQADQPPFGPGFIEAPQQELAKAAALFNLPEHGLDNRTPLLVDRLAIDTGQFRSQRIDSWNTLRIVTGSQSPLFPPRPRPACKGTHFPTLLQARFLRLRPFVQWAKCWPGNRWLFAAVPTLDLVADQLARIRSGGITPYPLAGTAGREGLRHHRTDLFPPAGVAPALRRQFQMWRDKRAPTRSGAQPWDRLSPRAGRGCSWRAAPLRKA